jgi:hypothetical protein
MGSKDVGVQTPSEVLMPTVVWYASRGKVDAAALVLLDGICVFARSSSRRDAILGQIARTAQKTLNIELKEEAGRGLQTADGPKGQYITFAGVEFVPGARWRPDARAELQADPRSKREVSSLLGSLMWHWRVCGENLCTQRGWALELASRVGATEGEWRLPFALTGEERTHLAEAVEERRKFFAEDRWCAGAPTPDPQFVVLVATDATRWRLAYVEYDEHLTPTPWAGPRLEEAAQALRELEAVVTAVEHIAERFRSTKKGTLAQLGIIVGMDPDGVRHGLEKEHFRSRAAWPLLARIRATGAQVAYVRVPGEDNVGDCPSRDNMDVASPDFVGRSTKTLRILRARREELRW